MEKENLVYITKVHFAKDKGLLKLVSVNVTEAFLLCLLGSDASELWDINGNEADVE